MDSWKGKVIQVQLMQVNLMEKDIDWKARNKHHFVYVDGSCIVYIFKIFY